MARFYVGQPVVCVWSREEWMKLPMHPECERYIPVKGNRYVVRHNSQRWGCEYIRLFGYDPRLFFEETGFAPITEEQVRDIIEEAHRAPSTREFETLE